MRSVKWRAALCSACSLASAGVLLFGAVTAAADEVDVAPPLKGTLYLKTGAFGKVEFRFDPVEEGDDIITQKVLDKFLITYPKKLSDICVAKLDPATVPPTETSPGIGLIQPLSATGGVAGITGDHLGVKGWWGACGDVNTGESLTIALGGALTGYQVFDTELNLEMKHHAVLQIDTAFNGDVHTFVIRNRSTDPVPPSAPPESPDVEYVICPYQSLGHHAEDDICRWKTKTLWDSATFKTLIGEVAIEAGTGGGSGTFSKFLLTKFDEVLGCPPTEGTPVGDPLTAPGPNDSEAILTRLQNADPEEACEPIPVSFEWDDEDPVLHLFKADLGQSVVTTLRITWPNEPAPPANIAAIPLSKQQFGTDTPIDIQLCQGTPVYGLLEGEVVLTALNDIPVPDQSTSLPGFQYGCVYERHSTLPAPGGALGLEEFIYLTGDWGASRAF